MNCRQIYARKAECEKRIKEVCPDCPNTSGIYFLLREEDGFRFAYIGQAKRLRERLASHLNGYQHIDLSIKKHGLWSEKNPTGYKIHFLQYPESVLDDMEQKYIKQYANAGYQLRNVESGGTNGKTDIGERRAAKGYLQGVAQGYMNARKDIAHLFKLYLDYAPKPKKGKFPTENQIKAMQKLADFINIEGDKDNDQT